MEKSTKILDLVSGDLNSDESNAVLSEINTNSKSQQEYNKVKLAWSLLASNKKMTPYRVEESYSSLMKKVSKPKNSAFDKLSPFIKYAALVVVLFSLSFFVFYLSKSTSIRFSDDTRYSTIVAEYGQTSKIILPDSSLIWLNSGTTLSYNNNYSVSNRKINLQGEAYFEVAHDESIPLIINSNGINIEVLGTEFNVESFSENDQINIALKEGSIKLSHTQNTFKEIVLKPGELAQFDEKNNHLKISEADINRISSWRDGILVFMNAPMSEVITKLERKYNIQIDVESQEVYNLVFSGTIKDESIENVFDMMKFASGVNYNIQFSHSKEIQTKIILNL